MALGVRNLFGMQLDLGFMLPSWSCWIPSSQEATPSPQRHFYCKSSGQNLKKTLEGCLNVLVSYTYDCYGDGCGTLYCRLKLLELLQHRLATLIFNVILSSKARRSILVLF